VKTVAVMFENKLPEHKSGQQKDKNIAKKTGNMVDRTLACRYELKYHISESTAEAISQFVKPYLGLDRYSKLQRRGYYPIVSLYLDSSGFHLCRETLTGKKNRYKLRIRSYTDEPEYPRFFEIKRRINTVIVKSRARVMEGDVSALLEGRSLPPQNFTADIDAINQFQMYLRNLKAGPKVLIRYMRQAYEGDSHTRVRVTFDRELAYKVTSKPEVILGGPGWQRNPYTSGGVILEIKFTERYPEWLNEMVKYFNLEHQSISKYASSISESCLLGFCAPRLMV
jgi:SPX domain protein involved in polyphosphate accumulation